MTDLFRRSSQWLERQRTRHAAHIVEYVRGGQSVEIAATVGRTTFEVDDGYGVLVRHESRDFLVLAGDLVINGSAIEPHRGDQIREIIGEATCVYEVTAPGKEPCWRWSDPYRQTMRIHTKQIEQQQTP